MAVEVKSRVILRDWKDEDIRYLYVPVHPPISNGILSDRSSHRLVRQSEGPQPSEHKQSSAWNNGHGNKFLLTICACCVNKEGECHRP